MSTSAKIALHEYEAMIARGDFIPPEEHHVELIRGEIVPVDPSGPLSPINPPHNDAVDELIDWSYEPPLRGRIRVRAQGSIQIPELASQPEPDLAWLAPRRYPRAQPTPADVVLLVEVSESTLAKDRGEKSGLYAEAGIRDYWIVDLVHKRVEVRRDPAGLAYQAITIHENGDEVRPLAFPEVALPVARLFPD